MYCWRPTRRRGWPVVFQRKRWRWRRRGRERCCAAGRLAPKGVALIGELRRLHACALALERLRDGGRRVGAGGEPFARRSALVMAVNAHLPQPVIEADFAGDAAMRAMRLLSGCWALLSVGWPRVSSLSVAAVRGAMDVETARVRALGGR